MTHSEKKCVGLLGGSFDPPHDGHILVSRLAVEYGLNEVLWLVVEQNPLKKNLDCLSAAEFRKPKT